MTSSGWHRAWRLGEKYVILEWLPHTEMVHFTLHALVLHILYVPKRPPAGLLVRPSSNSRLTSSKYLKCGNRRPPRSKRRSSHVTTTSTLIWCRSLPAATAYHSLIHCEKTTRPAQLLSLSQRNAVPTLPLSLNCFLLLSKHKRERVPQVTRGRLLPRM